jgi:hypothetical protein
MKHMNNQYNKINLQLFADEVAEPSGEVTEPAPETDPKDEKKYSDNDLDKIVNKKFARWKEEQAAELKKAQEEAAKLAKMNAEQKQQYELDKLKEENAQLKAAQVRAELGKTAAGLLAEKNIDATQDILDFVVGDDAEATNVNINKFVKIVEAQIKKAELVRATGTTPRTITNNGNTMSEIDKRIAKYS